MNIEASEGGSCHICGRELSNHKPREGELLDDGRVDYVKGIGICSEHGVSYDEISVRPEQRGNCHCEKEDCPTCTNS